MLKIGIPISTNLCPSTSQATERGHRIFSALYRRTNAFSTLKRHRSVTQEPNDVETLWKVLKNHSDYVTGWLEVRMCCAGMGWTEVHAKVNITKFVWFTPTLGSSFSYREQKT